MPENKKTGFTLIETILTIIIIGIIAGVTAKILLSGISTYTFVVYRKDAVQNSRVAMDRMVSEFLMLDNTDISGMSDQTIGFIDYEGNSTSFRRDNMQGIEVLKRGNDFLAGILNTDAFDFDYLKADGSDAVYNTDVARIRIDLAIDMQGGGGTVFLRTEVFPRNIMYNDFQ